MPASEQSHILVLGAGKGTRMGVPKAAMLVGGRVWCEVQKERLEAIGLPVTWVLSRESIEAIRAAGVRPERLGPVVMGSADSPMFDSLAAGVRTLLDPATASGASDNSGGLFVLPVDVPAPTRTTIALLKNPEHPTIPSFRGERGHPVYLPWTWLHTRAEFFETNTAEMSDRRLDHLIASSAVPVEIKDPSTTTNLNTPRDVQAWLDLQSSQQSRT